MAVGMHVVADVNTDPCVSLHEVAEIFNHEDYGSPNSESNDVSLLKLATPVTGYAPIDLLDGPGMDTPFQEHNAMLTVAGWGTMSSGGASSPEAMEVDVPVVQNENCNVDYSGQIDDTMICAGDTVNGGEDACQGDSGGPLFGIDANGNYVLTGIVSWGIGCADADFPGVYARVSYAREWICGIKSGVACPSSEPRPPRKVDRCSLPARVARVFREALDAGAAAAGRAGCKGVQYGLPCRHLRRSRQPAPRFRTVFGHPP